jgi:hypothetical protein
LDQKEGFVMSTLCISRNPAAIGTPPASRVPLTIGQTARFDDRRGLTISCGSGELWITQSGDARDIILVKGQRFVLDRDGRAVVEALADSEMEVGGA